MNKIEKDCIRAVKRSYNVDGRYWYGIEIKVKYKTLFMTNYRWQTAYLINRNTYDSVYFLHSLSPRNTIGISNWCEEQLKNINKYLEEGYVVVDQKTYNDYINYRRSIRENKNNFVYIK